MFRFCAVSQIDDGSCLEKKFQALMTVFYCLFAVFMVKNGRLPVGLRLTSVLKLLGDVPWHFAAVHPWEQ